MEYISRKQIKEDKRISIAIMSSFVILTSQYLILTYYNLAGTPIAESIQLISKGLVGFLYLLALPTVLKRNKIKFIGAYFISVFIFLSNYIIFKENWHYLQAIIFPFFFTALPSFIYAYSIQNWDIFMDIIDKASRIVFFLGMTVIFLVFTGSKSIGVYSMSLSYYMLLPTIIYLNKFLDNFTFKNFIIFVLALIGILSLGSRGAIMCIGVFIILKLIRSFSNINYKNILLYLLILTSLFIILISMNEILEYLYIFLLSHGIRSRSIALFLGEDVHLSGRDILYEIAIKETLNNPFLGIGLAGDRLVLGGTYAHNVFLEILLNFGIIFGAFIILLLIYIIIKSLLEKDIKKYNMIIIWTSIGFIPLFVSGSYLINFQFWIMLGLMINLRKKKSIKTDC